METDAGKVYTFDILAGFALLAWIFIYCLVPETANKKINDNVNSEIDENNEKCNEMMIV